MKTQGHVSPAIELVGFNLKEARISLRDATPDSVLLGVELML